MTNQSRAVDSAHLNSRRLFLASLAAAWSMATTALTGCGVRELAPQSRYLLLDGSTISTSDIKGKVALINFWATTCATCVKEMPELVDIYKKFHPRGFETIAVAMSYDPPNWVLNFVKTRQLPFKVALDSSGQVAKEWGDIKLTPTTFLIDRDGRIIKKYVGAPDFIALQQLIETLLTDS
jgi:peroxiredoxin